MILKKVFGFTLLLCLPLIGTQSFADTLVASQSFTAPNCSWNQWAITFQGYGITAQTRNLICDGSQVATQGKTSAPANYGSQPVTTCSFTAATGFTASGDCANFSVNRKAEPVVIATQSYTSSGCSWDVNWMIVSQSYVTVKQRGLYCAGVGVAATQTKVLQGGAEISCSTAAAAGHTGSGTCLSYTITKNP